LQTERERVKAYLALSLSDLKCGIMDVHKISQSNTKLAQENFFLRDAIAKEMDGQWSSSLDDEWSSSFEALSSNVEQHFLTCNDHDGLPNMMEGLRNACFGWPSLPPKFGTSAHAANPRSFRDGSMDLMMPLHVGHLLYFRTVQFNHHKVWEVLVMPKLSPQLGLKLKLMKA